MNAKIICMPTVKKTWLIDPVLVTRARKICGARTETETVTQALRDILVRDEIDKAFRDAFMTLDRRIGLFLCLPLSSLDKLAIQKNINDIGRQR